MISPSLISLVPVIELVAPCITLHIDLTATGFLVGLFGGIVMKSFGNNGVPAVPPPPRELKLGDARARGVVGASVAGGVSAILSSSFMLKLSALGMAGVVLTWDAHSRYPSWMRR
jgi:hypothetical protein